LLRHESGCNGCDFSNLRALQIVSEYTVGGLTKNSATL
jgi:hypothetical protein